jgi:Ca2+-binding EF-hand superfamily protein
MDLSSIGMNSSYGIFATGKMQKPPGDLDEATDRLIQDKDKNSDGTLNALEICISDEAFQQADANGDGELDADELKDNVEVIGKELAAQGPPPRPPGDDDEDDEDSQASTLEEVFQQADTNGDGVLSAEEFAAAADEIGGALKSQRPEGPPPPPPQDLDRATEGLVQNLDKNGDGTLSSDEIGISQEVFGQADTNSDGQLSSDELKANAQIIGQELASREAALRQYSLMDYLKEEKSDGEEAFNLTI